MADHSLKPRPALGGKFLAVESIGPVTISEVTDIALASLAARRNRGAEVTESAASIGLLLPQPGRAVTNDSWSAFWVSPDMWFVETPLSTREDIVAHLKPIFGEAASVTEQTDAWVRFQVTGSIQPLFERLSNLDIGRMEPNSATRTVIEHVGCYAIRRAEDSITLLGPRSMAGSLHHALTTAARSVF